MRKAIEYLAYRALAFLVPLLPRGAMVWLGRRLGGLYFLLSARAREVGRENLARVFPERTDREWILRESMRLQVVAALDAAWAGGVRGEKSRRVIDMTAFREDLEANMDGRGLVCATAHLGSWEMLNLAGGAQGLPRINFIARPIQNLWIDAHLKKRRERTGNRLVYRERALLVCTSALRNNELVTSPIDMAISPAEGGSYVEFFGLPALTSLALPMLAVRRKAPFFFLACHPVDRGRRYELRWERLETREYEDRDAEIMRLAREANRCLERAIRRQPEAWIWNYKRWKARPTDDPVEYPTYALWNPPRSKA